MVAALRLDGIWRPWLFLLVLLASFLVHAATNLLNDYFDHDLGVDSKESIGGSRVIQEGKISPGSIRAASFLLYLSAFLLAIAIVGRYRALWGMVVFAALSSFFYVAPPIKYGHRALGELFVFLNMGLVMCLGTYMALTGKYSPQPVAMSLPVALMVAGILYFQSLPEIETDKAAGKLTLAGLLGKERSALVFLLWWPLVWLLMATLYFSGLAAWPALLGPLALPFHITACRRIKAAKDWLELDASGHLVRKEYFLNGLCLIVGVAMGPFPPVA
jgi:1,4-dihydroxy-2-naphthoate octaprenyltransferase